jgi:hypothetical protein
VTQEGVAWLSSGCVMAQLKGAVWLSEGAT